MLNFRQFSLVYQQKNSLIFLQVFSDNETNIFDYNCSTLIRYSKGICVKPLKNILRSNDCKPNRDGSVQVLSNAEKMARKLFHALSAFTSKPACKKTVVPFLCLYLFGVCGGIDTILYITSGICKRVRDVDCVDEWKLASALADSKGEILPDCDQFPPVVINCKDKVKRDHPSSAGKNNNQNAKLLDVCYYVDEVIQTTM